MFTSVALVVGLVPGFAAWGDSKQATTPAFDEVTDVGDANANGMVGEGGQTQDNPIIANTEDERDENGGEPSGGAGGTDGTNEADSTEGAPGEDNAVQGEETAEAESEDALLAASIIADNEEPAQDVLAAADAEGLDAANDSMLQAASTTYTVTCNKKNKTVTNTAVGARAGDTINLVINIGATTGGYYLYQSINSGSEEYLGPIVEHGKKNESYYYTYTVPAGCKVARTANRNASSAIIYLESLPRYTVTLNSNGATNWSGTTDLTDYEGSKLKISKSSERAGYKFSGWNTAADGSGTHYDNGASISLEGSMTLYAEWTRTVTLSASGSDASFTPASPITFYYDAAGAGRPTSVTVNLTGWNGWKAYGWTTGSASTAVTKNADASFTLSASDLTKISTTYYALLQRDLTVKYDANGADSGTAPGDTTATQVINTRSYTGSYTKNAVTLAEPNEGLQKDHYDFAGWTINDRLYNMKGDTAYTWANANASAQVTAYATWEYNPLDYNRVTVKLKGWTYGDTPNKPEITATHAADTAKVEYSDSRSGTYSEDPPTKAGTYWVRATVAEDASANYREGVAIASFTIAPKEVGIDWENDVFDYDGEKHAPTAKVKAVDLIGGDTCEVTVSGEQDNAGTYTAWASKLSNANYTLPSEAPSHSFTIKKAKLTVKAKNHEIIYGDAPQANGVTYTDATGVESESKPTGLTGSLSYAFDYRQYDDISTESKKYTIEPSGLGGPNYDISYEPGELTVSPREVTFLWSMPNSFAYNGESQTWPKPTVGNAVNGDDVVAEWALSAVATAVEKGTYMPAVGGLSGAKARNYSLPDTAAATGSWSIVAPGEQSMTVSIAGWTYGKYDKDKNGPTVSAAYGADEATFEYFVDNEGELGARVEGDGLDAKGVPINAGDYWVKATVAPTTDYPGGTATCAFTISKRKIAIRANDVWTNSSSAELTATIVGEVASDADAESIMACVELSCNRSIINNNTLSLTAKVIPSLREGVDSPTNYELEFVEGTYYYGKTGASELTRIGSATVRGNFVYDGQFHSPETTVDGARSSSYPLTTFYSSRTLTADDLGLDSSQFSFVRNGTVSTGYNSTVNTDEQRLDAFKTAWVKLSSGAIATSTVPKYKDVGSYNTSFWTLGLSEDQATYTSACGTGTTIITPAPLVVKAKDVEITCGETPSASNGVGVDYYGFVGGENASVLTGTLSYDYGAYSETKAAGRYPITPKGLSSKNYSITYKPGTLIVKPGKLTVEWPDANTFNYDGNKHSYAPTLRGVPTGCDVKLKLAGTSESTDAGTYTVQIIGLEGDDAAGFEFDDSSVLSHKWSITPAILTIKANDNEITYGDAPAGNGVICTDANNNAVDISSLPGTLQYAFTDSERAAYEQYGDVGEYTITPSLPDSSNYTITYRTGTLRVVPRTVSLIWPSPTALRWTGLELTYGTPILGNVVNGDDVSINAEAYSGNKGKDGGSYRAVVDASASRPLSGAKAGNYTLPENGLTQDWSIYGAANNVRVSIDDWTYGEAAKTPTVTGDNLVGREVGYSTSPYGPFDSTTVPVNSTGKVDAGTYYVRASVPATDVYDAAEVVAEFHVLPREVTLTWTNTSFKYDTYSHVPTATVDAESVLSGDSCAVLDVSGAAVNAGTHTATAIALTNPNYKLPINDSVQFTIAPKKLTVTAEPNEITYGDAPAGNGVTCIDENNEPVSVESLSGTLSYSFDYRQYGDVGTYKITPGGLSSPNYAITYETGELTVSKRVVTLTWDAPSTFTYNGDEHTWGVPTVGNTVNGDKLTATWAQGAVFKATDVGTYTPKVDDDLTAGTNAVTGATTNVNNYKLPDPAVGTWSIAPPTANAMSVSIAGWTYGKTPNSPVVRATFMPENVNDISYAYYKDNGGKPGDEVPAADMKDGKPRDAGDYWVKATIPAGPNNNYPAAEATCAFAIEKADITITADDKVAVRSETAPVAALTYTVSGDFASGDSVTGIVEASSKVDPDDIKPARAGSYAINMGWASDKGKDDLPNYNVKFEEGTYTVTRALANVSATGYSGDYDGVADAEHIAVDVTAATGNTGSGPIEGTRYTATGVVKVYYSETDFASNENVGAATLSTLQTEPDVSSEAFRNAWSALQAAITAKRYTDQDTAYTYKDAGPHRVYFMVVSDQVTPDVIVGYKDVVINKVPLVVRANDNSIAYGEAAADKGVTYSGFVPADLDNGEPKDGVINAERLAYSYGTYTTTPTPSAPGRYPIVPSGLEAENYSITYEPGTLTVGAKELDLKWPEKNEFPYNGHEQEYRPKLIDPSTGNEVAGADVSAQMTAGTYAKTDAGSYTATVAGLAGDDKGNYVLKPDTEYTHPWSITPIKLIVRAEDNVITYGDAPAAAGVKYLDGEGNEVSVGAFTGSLSYSYDYAQFGPVGTYAITPSGIASPNYTITFVSGKLTVRQKPLTLKWSDDDKLEYTGKPWTYEKPLLDGVLDGDNVRVGVYSGARETNVGVYTASVESFTGRDVGNYLLPLATDTSHQWMILGVENGLELTMDDWTYGDEPRAPRLAADHGSGTATFSYYLDAACEKKVPTADLDSNGVPAVAGSYWVKATVPKSDAGNYRAAEAVAGFKVERRPLTIKASNQIVKVGDAVASDARQVTADGLAAGDEVSSVALSARSTAWPSLGGSVTPSAATIVNAGGRDVTSSYDITYEPGGLNVVGDYSTENNKVIYVVLADIWVTVDEAAELLADPGLDGILMERTGAAAYETGTGNALEVHVLDRGGLAAAVGVYSVTFETNPQVSARVHVMSSSSTDDETGVTVYANDTEPSADLLRRAKAGDADAIAELIALAGAVAMDEDGNAIPVTDVDLSAVDPDEPGTYRAAYSTDDGDSAAANVVLKEGADEPDPKDGLREKIEEAEGIVGPLDPANPTDEEKKLLEEIDAAKLILDDPDATPDQIRDAIKRLDDAIAALKAARDKKDSPAAASATKPDSARKATTAKTGDALPVALLTTTALAAACALAFAYRRRES